MKRLQWKIYLAFSFSSTYYLSKLASMFKTGACSFLNIIISIFRFLNLESPQRRDDREWDRLSLVLLRAHISETISRRSGIFILKLFNDKRWRAGSGRRLAGIGRHQWTLNRQVLIKMFTLYHTSWFIFNNHQPSTPQICNKYEKFDLVYRGCSTSVSPDLYF